MKRTGLLLMCLLALAACKGPEKQIFANDSDLGSVSIPGSSSYDTAADCYTITGAGANLWESRDACHLVWRKVSGDFLMSGTVSFEGEGVNPHRKIGFMVRESLDEDARYADVAIHGDGLTSLQFREDKGGITLERASDKKLRGSVNIRLARVGNRISMRASNGELPESDDAAILLDLPDECYVALFVCSHEEEISETAYFRNVTFTQDIPAERGLARISIFCDHIGTLARQEGITFAEAAEKLRDIGYTGADIRVFQSPSELRTLDSLGFARACAITDIDCSVDNQKELEFATLEFMQDKNISTVLLVPGLLPRDCSDNDRNMVISRIARFINMMSDYGIQVLVEDFDNPRSICYNAVRLDSLLTVSPKLNLVFDTGNFLYAGDDTRACLDRFCDRVSHVHLKDRVSATDMTCVPIGTGCTPAAELIGRLLESGYNGWFTVEQYGSRNMLPDSRTAYENTLAAIRAARDDN